MKSPLRNNLAGLDAEAIKRVFFGTRDRMYYEDVLARFVDAMEKTHVQSIFSFGGFNTPKFVPGFSDIDVAVVLEEDSDPNQTIENCLLIGRAVFQATYGLPLLKPYVFTLGDLEGDTNPFFSENVLQDLRVSMRSLYGDETLNDVSPSSSIGFRADAYFFRSWLRRQLASSALVFAPGRIAKAILRWTKVTAIYVSRSRVLSANELEILQRLIATIDTCRAAFPSASKHELLAWSLTFGLKLEGLTTAILRNGKLRLGESAAAVSCPSHFGYVSDLVGRGRFGAFREDEVLEAELVWQDEVFE